MDNTDSKAEDEIEDTKKFAFKGEDAKDERLTKVITTAQYHSPYDSSHVM